MVEIGAIVESVHSAETGEDDESTLTLPPRTGADMATTRPSRAVDE